MPEKLKKNKEILSRLDQDEDDKVLFAIEQLRQNGDKSVTQRLIDILLEDRSREINNAAKSFLFDIKDADSRIVIIDAIKNTKYNNILEILVSACWQSGMAYAEHLPVFTDLVINSTYGAAFEAFTVIEEMSGTYDPKIVQKEIARLKKASLKADEHKKILLSELVNILQG